MPHTCVNMIFVFLFLTYFALYDRLKVHPRIYKWPNFIPFYGWVIFHCIYVPQFCWLSCWWLFKWLLCIGYYESCCNEYWGYMYFFYFILSCISCLYILQINYLSAIYLQIFSPILRVVLSSCLLLSLLGKRKVFKFNLVSFVHFCFYFHYFRRWVKKILL